MELSNESTVFQKEFSHEQWNLIREAIYKPDSLPEDQGFENRLEALVPEIIEPISYVGTTGLLEDSEKQPSKKIEKKSTYRYCPICSKLVSKISGHLRMHADERNYPCSHCPALFREACNRMKHEKIVHAAGHIKGKRVGISKSKVLKSKKNNEPERENKSLHLPNCFKLGFKIKKNRATQSSKTAIMHFLLSKKQMLDEEKELVPVEEHFASTQYPKIKKIKKNRKTFACTLCEKKYGRIGHLNKHKLTHYKEKTQRATACLDNLECTFCKKKFKYDSNLQDHLNTHTRQKPHICINCNKAFAARSNLLAHMRHYCSQS